MSENEANPKKAAKKAVAKKTTTRKTAKKAPAKKAAAKTAPAAKKTAKPKGATASRSIPTLAQLQEAAYFHYLERLRTGSHGDPGTDWAAAVAQFES